MRAVFAVSLAVALLAPAVASADGVVVFSGGGGFRAGFRGGARIGFGGGYRTRVPMAYRPIRFSRPPTGWYASGYASGAIGIGVQVDSGPSCDYPVYTPPPAPCCATATYPVYNPYPVVVAEPAPQPSRMAAGVRLIAGHAGDENARGGDYGGVGGYVRFALGPTVAIELAAEALRHDDQDRNVERTDLPITAGLLLFLNGPGSSLRPFLSGGLGYTMATAHSTGSVSESENYGAGYLGAGLSARLGRGIRLDLEARYNRKDRVGDERVNTQILASGGGDKAGTTIALLPEREEASEARIGLTFLF
jgi:opacity protein-like surface antigen